jgi:hypothetical protein
MNSNKESKNNAAKVWSCGSEHCPHDRYWPSTFSYTDDYVHYVWGSDKKFRTGVDTCGKPQFLSRWELRGKGTFVTPKHCHNPLLRVEAGTQLKWRQSSVGLNVRPFQPAFPSCYNRSPKEKLRVMNTEHKHWSEIKDTWRNTDPSKQRSQHTQQRVPGNTPNFPSTPNKGIPTHRLPLPLLSAQHTRLSNAPLCLHCY